MPSVVVVGTQWGDEGKGKLVDYLTAHAEYVARFQGGNNAGHTLVVGGLRTSLSLVPSGILHPQTRCVLGAGVVINPDVLISEIENLQKLGIDVNPKRLTVDREAHLILPYHIYIDQAREDQKGPDRIGTTGRGIGPVYEDRAARYGVKIGEITDLESLRKKLERYVDLKNKYLTRVLDAPKGVSFEEVWDVILRARGRLLPYLGNVSIILDKACRRGNRVVFEGAQGTLLDATFGTVPYVTSSNTIAGAVMPGCGLGVRAVDYVLGIAKAYLTRVGEGPFPTELKDELGVKLREIGGEYGTVTRRPRRCGWFDAVAMRRAIRLNGVDSLAVTKLDILSGIEKVKICVKYEMDGKEIDEFPAIPGELERITPQFVEFSGWTEDLTGVRSWYDLPVNARLYLDAISEIVGCPISIVSIGPERMQTLFFSGAKFLKNFIAEEG